MSNYKMTDCETVDGNAVLKIVQIIISPDNSTYQGSLLGLGSDGAIYRAENDNKWYIYFPNRFAGE